MSSIVLKVKNSFTKASKKGIECDMIYLTNQDYSDFCSDLKMEGVSEIDINGIKLSIVKIEGKDKSYLNIKSFKMKRKKMEDDEDENINKLYI